MPPSAACLALVMSLALGDWPVLISPNPRDADMDAFLPLALRDALQAEHPEEVCLAVVQAENGKAKDPSEHVLDETAQGLPEHVSLKAASACAKGNTRRPRGGPLLARVAAVAGITRPKPGFPNVDVEVERRYGLLSEATTDIFLRREDTGWRIVESLSHATPPELSPDEFLPDGWGETERALKQRFPNLTPSSQGRWCRDGEEMTVCYQFVRGRLREVEMRLKRERDFIAYFQHAFGPTTAEVPSISQVDYRWSLPEYVVTVTQGVEMDVWSMSFKTKRILWSAPGSSTR